MLFYNLEVPSQFGSPLSGQRVLQYEITVTPDDDGKYFVGFGGSKLPTIYFITPEENATWANGLDDRNTVCECISSFESHDKAHERANDFAHNSKYEHAHFFKAKYHEKDGSLELVLVSTSSK